MAVSLKLTQQLIPTPFRFHISDNGIGISAEHLEKILEPLFTTKARGMGLGLSISRAIVEKNKGQLSVESELGQGKLFHDYVEMIKRQ